MVSIKERVIAGSMGFGTTVKELSAAVARDAKVAVDPKSGDFAAINGVIFMVGTTVMMLPLAIGESVRAFIKPPEKKKDTI
jgi:hypothetical protein